MTTRTVAHLDMTGIATRTGLSAQYVRELRASGALPAPDVTVGRNPGWLPATVDQWWLERAATRTTTTTTTTEEN